MKRPLAVLGFTYLITQAVVCYFSFSINLTISLCCFTAGMFLWFTRMFEPRKIFLLVLFAVAFATGTMFFHQRMVYTPAVALDGMEVEITAQIVDTPERLSSGSYRYTMETTQIGAVGSPQNLRLLVTSRKPLDVEYYDLLTFRTELSLTNRSYWAEGVYLKGYVESDILYVPVEEKPLSFYLVKFREQMNQNIMELLPEEEGGLVSAMVTGTRDEVKQSGVYDLFTKGGVTHFIAISGLHMSILGAMALYFLRKLKFLPHWIPYLFSSVFVLLYMAVLGFAPSATRSGIMLIVFYLARCIGRKSDSLNSLGLAALLISLPNPLNASSISLQLSMLATLAMLTVAPKVKDWVLDFHPILRKYRALRWCANLLGTSVGVTAVLLPLLLLYFGRISLISPVINLFLFPIAPVIVIFGFLTAMVGMASSIVALPFAFFAGLAAKASIFIVEIFSNFDFLALTDDAPYIWIWMIFTLFIFGFCFLRREKLSMKLGVLFSAFLFLTGALSYHIMMQGVSTFQIYGGENTPWLVAETKSGTIALPLYEPSSGQVFAPVDNNRIDLLFLEGNYQCYQDVFSQYEIGAVVIEKETPLDQLTPLLPTGCKAYWKGNMQAALGDITVETLELSDATATTVRIGDFSLLLTCGDMDASVLPLSRTAPDVWVAQGNCQNPEKIASRYGVVMEGAGQRKIWNSMLSQGAKTFYFEQNGRIDILTRGQEDIKVFQQREFW